MDAMAGLLDGPRARGAFLLRSTLAAPWSVLVQDEAPLTLVAVVRGDAWFLREGEPEVHLLAGDVTVITGTTPYVFADHPSTAPQVVIHPGQRCATPDGVEVAPMTTMGVRNWGNSVDGPTMLLTGTYPQSGEVGLRLLNALPG